MRPGVSSVDTRRKAFIESYIANGGNLTPGIGCPTMSKDPAILSMIGQRQGKGC